MSPNLVTQATVVHELIRITPSLCRKIESIVALISRGELLLTIATRSLMAYLVLWTIVLTGGDHGKKLIVVVTLVRQLRRRQGGRLWTVIQDNFLQVATVIGTGNRRWTSSGFSTTDLYFERCCGIVAVVT